MARYTRNENKFPQTPPSKTNNMARYTPNENKFPHTPPSKTNNMARYTPNENKFPHTLPSKTNNKAPYKPINKNDKSPHTPPNKRQNNIFRYPPPSASSAMNPAELPCSMQSLNHLPPLMNLITTNKKTQKSWNEIEAQNLETILESAKPVEMYLCDTTIRNIYQSFRDDRLDISQRNMENIASSGGSRSKRFFILRVSTPESGRFIAGVASVNQSAGVTRIHCRTDRYLVAVKYLAVSCPLLSDLTAHNHFDGMEVYPSVFNRLFQQYKFQLAGNKVCCVRPLFQNITVSNTPCSFYS